VFNCLSEFKVYSYTVTLGLNYKRTVDNELITKGINCWAVRNSVKFRRIALRRGINIQCREVREVNNIDKTWSLVLCRQMGSKHDPTEISQCSCLQLIRTKHRIL